MENLTKTINILGLLVAIAGVFVEPLLLRGVIVFLGVLLVSFRFY